MSAAAVCVAAAFTGVGFGLKYMESKRVVPQQQVPYSSMEPTNVTAPIVATNLTAPTGFASDTSVLIIGDDTYQRNPNVKAYLFLGVDCDDPVRARPGRGGQADTQLLLVVDAAAQPQLSLNCRAAILVEQESGRVLYEKNADEAMPIASITKVMTLLLTFEAIHNGQLTLETTVPVSEHAYHMGGSQIWLEPGEQFTLDEMIKAICVSSANDAAVAVAELVGGSEPAFVERMNARAAELGMEHTTFHNACGLDTEGHLSTARDVAVMSCQILNTCPEVLHYTGIWTDTLRGGATQLVNTNKLLHRYNGITGLKTGTTGGAGVCISASAARDGLRLVAVILGAPSSKDRFEAAAALLDYGFGGWQAAPLPAPEVQPLQLKVKGSAEDGVPLDYSALPQTVLLPREGTAALTAQACLPQQLEAPVEKGQTVGTVQVYHGETLLGEYEVKAAADAPRMDFGTAFSLLWGSLTG